jgi:hypothetical protein
MTPLQQVEERLGSLTSRVEANAQAEDDAHQRVLHGASAHAPPPPTWRTVSEVLDVALQLLAILKNVTAEVERMRHG